MMDKIHLIRVIFVLLSHWCSNALGCTDLGVSFDPASVSLSGISAGGAMATQYHVAHSASVMGAGLFASPGPYYCAESSITFALGRCMTNPENIPTADLIQLTDQFWSEGTIDDPANIAGDKVYIFQGTLDDVVVPEVSPTVDEYYAAFGADIVVVDNVASGHGQPTVDEGNVCSSSASPYVNRCEYDGAYEALNHIYGGDLIRPDPTDNSPLPGSLLEFDQREYVADIGGPESISLADTGYIYVPSGCQGGAAVCKLHVAFHGCLQSYGSVGDDYITLSGYNEVGELNNIVILYPQTVRSFTIPYNPNGCFDWWGYNDPALDQIYPTQLGHQIIAMKAMVDCLLSGGEAVTTTTPAAGSTTADNGVPPYDNDYCEGLANGRYAYEDDCAWYYECVNHVTSFLECPESLLYSVNMRDCVLPESIDQEYLCSRCREYDYDNSWDCQ